MFQAGTFHAVPVIVGDVSDEARMFVYPDNPDPVPSAQYTALINAVFQPDGNQVCSSVYEQSSLEREQVLNEYPVPADNASFDCRINIDLLDRSVFETVCH